MKSNWIKACEDTQKKLEKYEKDMSQEWAGCQDCSFCKEDNKNPIDSGACFNCPVSKTVCNKTLDKLVEHPTTELILAHWMYLEHLKGMLKRGKL